jgi:hypothetical protein
MSRGRRELGIVALLQEEGRDARGARWIESCAADVRFAMRHCLRMPLTGIKGPTILLAPGR